MHGLWLAACQILLLAQLALAVGPEDYQPLERQSLQLFFSQTAGTSWTRQDKWTLDTTGLQSDSHCSWYGVTCCTSSGEGDTGHGSLPCSTTGAVVALVRADIAADLEP